ncbi:MAG: FtsW/RodA/SpoVE family cell cycle protein [Candidatus Saccharibacteria bacterium]|nr:FtsW/RodA/SpoVE family cell cycle protein [Candidatus Saccharibacteria bacterium]
MQRTARRVRQASARTADFVRKHRPDYSIIAYAALLVMIGLIIIFAIGPQRANLLNESSGSNLSDSHFIVKQTVGVALAVVAFFAFSFLFRFEKILQYKAWIFGAGIAASLLLVLFGNILHVESVAQCALGACRWLIIPGVGTFQPAELLKFGVLIYLAGFLAYRLQKGIINDTEKTIIPLLGVLVVCAVLVIWLQRDLGTGVALISIMVAMGMMAGIDKKIGMFLLGGLLISGLVMIIAAPHRIARVATFLKGDETSVNDPGSYHVAHAKIAIGSGGLFGVGIGNSVQAAGYLPEAINDSVFAILGETFGFVGLLLVLGLFYMLLRRIIRVMERLPDVRYRLLAAGVFGWIASHVIINVMAMIGMIPLTGITLPFLSFGSTSMVFIAAALGLVFQVSQYTVHQSEIKEVRHEDSRSGRRVGRTRYAGRRSTR